MNFKDIKNQNWFPYTVAICVGILFYYLLQRINLIGDLLSGAWKICTPFIIALILAYLMDPIVRFFTEELFYPLTLRKDSARKIAIPFTCLVIIGVLALLIVALVPQLIKSTTGVLLKMDVYEARLLELAHNLNIDNATVQSVLNAAFDKLNELLPNITDILVKSTQNIGSGVANALLGFILAIYFLSSKSTIIEWLKVIFRRSLGDESYPTFANLIKRCDKILLRYVSASLVEAVFVGIGNFVLMVLFQMPLAMLISIVVGVTNLAPTFGPIVGGAIGFLLLVLEKPVFGVYFLIFTLVIQTIDGYVIKPKLFGNTFGVSALWILIAIIIGGKLLGVTGLLLAIPIAAIVQFLLEDYLFPYTRSRPQKESLLSRWRNRKKKATEEAGEEPAEDK